MASGPAWKKSGSFRRERERTTSIPQHAPRIDHSVPLMVVTSPEFPIRRTKNAGGEREFPQHGNVTAKFAHNIPKRALQPKLNRDRQGWRPRISWIIDDVVCAERSSRNCSLGRRHQDVPTCSPGSDRPATRAAAESFRKDRPGLSGPIVGGLSPR